jgi:hypothetical protein
VVPHAPARLPFLLAQRPNYCRSAFGSQGQALSPQRRELKHLLLDDVAAVAQRALEQRGLLEDGRLNGHAVVRCHHARCSVNDSISGCDVGVEEIACTSHAGEASCRCGGGGAERAEGGEMKQREQTSGASMHAADAWTLEQASGRF